MAGKKRQLPVYVTKKQFLVIDGYCFTVQKHMNAPVSINDASHAPQKPFFWLAAYIT